MPLHVFAGVALSEIKINHLTGRREMTTAEVLEREVLNAENTASALARRAAEGRAKLNGKVPSDKP